MNLDQVVQRGCPAWRPSEAASDLDVWHANDAPMIGTFTLGDGRMLFTCVGDVDSPSTIWAYAPLSPAEVGEFEDIEFDSLLDMFERVSQVFDGRDAVYAYARDYEVSKWCPLATTAGLYPTAHKFLDDIARAIGSRVSDESLREDYGSEARRRESRSLIEHTEQVRSLASAGR